MRITKNVFPSRVFFCLIVGVFLCNFAVAAQDDENDWGDNSEGEVSMPEHKLTSKARYLNTSIGIRTGVARTDMSNYADSWEYGAEVEFQPTTHYSYAFELSGYVSEADKNEDLPSLTRTRLLGKGIYNVSGTTPFIRYFYIGAGVGPIWDNFNNKVATEVGFAPTLGFDIPFNEGGSGFTIGANANYLFISGDKPETFAMNGVLKYKFY